MSIHVCLKIIASAAVVLLFAGCGSFLRVTYNHADFGLRRIANEYFDPNAEQTTQLRERIARYHAWHRRAEVPRYIEFLDDLSGRLRSGLTPDDALWANDSIQGAYRRLIARALVDLTPLLPTLTPANLAQLERKLRESNERFERENDLGDRERHERDRLKTLTQRYRDWLGELTAAQSVMIAEYVASSPRFYSEQLEERRRRHSMVLAALRQPSVPAHARDRLHELLVDFRRHRSPSYRVAAEQWEQRLVRLLLSIERSLTDRQRLHLLDRIGQYALDFRLIAADGVPSPRTAPELSLALPD